MSQLAITDNIDSMDANITALEEEIVTKFDGAYAENGLLYLTAKGVVIGQGIEVGSGTGGGGWWFYWNYCCYTCNFRILRNFCSS